MAQTIKLKRTATTSKGPADAPSFVAGEMMMNTTDLKLWAMGDSSFEIATSESSISVLKDVDSSISPSDGQALVYDSTNGWQAEDLPGDIIVTDFTATSGQTTFTVNYTVNSVAVFTDGVKLRSSEYTASNGTSIVLNQAQEAGAWVQVVASDYSGTITNAATLEGNSGSYYLNWSNFTNTPTTISGYGITDGLTTSWTGSTNIDTVGTITTGTWNGTSIGDSYISSASTWNSKISDIVGDTTPQLGGDLDPNGKAIVGTIEKKIAMSANDIDASTGNVFTKTISADTTFTVSNIAGSGYTSSFILELTNAGAYTIPWFSVVKWEGGTAPTLTSSGVDVLGFYTHDAGTTWRASVLSLDSK